MYIIYRLKTEKTPQAGGVFSATLFSLKEGNLAVS